MNQKLATGVAVIALVGAAVWMYSSEGGDRAASFEQKQAEIAGKIAEKAEKQPEQPAPAVAQPPVKQAVDTADGCAILSVDPCQKVSYAFGSKLVDVVKVDGGHQLVVDRQQIVPVSKAFYDPATSLIAYAELLGVTVRAREVAAARTELRQTQRGFLLQVDLPQGTVFITAQGQISGQLK